MQSLSTEVCDARSDGAIERITLADLAGRLGGVLVGDGSVEVLGVASIEDAGPGDIVFAENDRFVGKAVASRASAVVALPDAAVGARPSILVDDPRYAFTQILELFSATLHAPAGVHPSAVVGDGALVDPSASIGPCAVIGHRAVIGAGSAVLACAAVGDDCVVGADCVIHPNVTLNARCVLGDRVVIHSGTVIGADGFGYMRIGDRTHKVPQVGNVEIGDDVEIGACTAVDRAKTGSTVIGARTKVDNLVQIAHNCKIGSDCIVVAQVGLAGGASLGRGVVIAGQAGVNAQTAVGDGTMVLARAGVQASVGGGQIVSGNPARPHREQLRTEARVARLGVLQARVSELEKVNQELVELAERLESRVAELAARMDGGAA